MIKFKTIKWRNFLSTGNQFTEVNVDSNEPTLIVGENGAGKSTVLDALTYGLFSKPFRKVNKPQLINSVNKKDCLVEIEFEIGNKQYSVIRGMNPGRFEIYIDGELLNQSAKAKDYQYILEKQILKLNWKSFTQIIILGSSSFRPFMQLNTAHRREVIEDLLDIQIFSIMNMLLKDKMTENKKFLDSCTSQLDLLGEKIDLQKKYISEVVEINNDKIKNVESSILQYGQSISKYKESIEGCLQTISGLSEGVENYDEISKVSKQYIKLEGQIENKFKKVVKDIEFFEDLVDCPMCKQDVESSHKDHILGDLKNKSNEYGNALTELESKINDNNSVLNRMHEIHKNIEKIQNEIRGYEFSIKGDSDYIEKLNGEVEYLLKVRSKSSGDQSKLNSLYEEKEKISGELTKSMENRRYYEVAFSLFKDTGIKTNIIKQYLPVMNHLINKNLSMMNCYFNFMLDENFNETIKSRGRDKFSYDSFSEGEKMRIDLALLFTWRAIAKMKNSASTNLLILDEVFDSSLDSTGTEDFMKLLVDLSQSASVYVISHKGDILQDKFTRTIKFEKQNNFSKMLAI
tara:strand:- start:7063 stop:8781 length:1719 start_codon:yes stop_codon:yes gene_type:complete